MCYPRAGDLAGRWTCEPSRYPPSSFLFGRPARPPTSPLHLSRPVTHCARTHGGASCVGIRSDHGHAASDSRPMSSTDSASAVRLGAVSGLGESPPRSLAILPFLKVKEWLPDTWKPCPSRVPTTVVQPATARSSSKVRTRCTSVSTTPSAVSIPPSSSPAPASVQRHSAGGEPVLVEHGDGVDTHKGAGDRRGSGELENPIQIPQFAQPLGCALDSGAQLTDKLEVGPHELLMSVSFLVCSSHGSVLL